MKKWIEAARPKTLTAALVPILAGTALARASGYAPKLSLSLFALLSAFCIQIGTNLFNDAIDFKKGTDNETRIGPRRVTQSGLLSSRAVMLGGAFFFLLAAAFGIPLLIAGGSVILSIGILSLICGYAYTGGPFPLAYLGLGELFVILFFGLAAVGGVFYLHTGLLPDTRSMVAGLQVGFLSTVLIAINNLRDAEGDKKTDKRTLAVRFGKTFARREIALLAILPAFMGIYWIWVGLLWAGFLPLLILPLAFHISNNVARTEPGPTYNRFLGQAALLHLLFGLLFSLGCLLSWYAPGGGS
ncbi:MAG: 1,4-dihydroxy-2-naphthoate octaprenyltransferase [Oligoflexia bacterium]|nr:1,4-dihydroxy-2-naphthoate octaprenyltransferase [Oligoflexia bacterium]